MSKVLWTQICLILLLTGCGDRSEKREGKEGHVESSYMLCPRGGASPADLRAELEEFARVNLAEIVDRGDEATNELNSMTVSKGALARTQGNLMLIIMKKVGIIRASFTNLGTQDAVVADFRTESGNGGDTFRERLLKRVGESWSVTERGDGKAVTVCSRGA